MDGLLPDFNYRQNMIIKFNNSFEIAYFNFYTI